MGHIHTEPGQFDQTVSVFVLNIAGDEPTLLLHQHRLVGKLMQPGGHVELNESHWGSAAHELLEETGFELEQLELLQPRPRLRDAASQLLPLPILTRQAEFWLTPGHFHEDFVYGFITRETPRHAVAEGESADLRWVTLVQLLALPAEAVIADVIPIGQTLLERWYDWDVVPVTGYRLS